MGNAPLCVIIALQAGHARPAGKRLTDTNGKPAAAHVRPLQLYFCLHIRAERIRHGVYLGQILGRGPNIALRQLACRGSTAPAAQLPDLVGKHMLCRGQCLAQRGPHAQCSQRSGQLFAGQALFPTRRAATNQPAVRGRGGAAIKRRAHSRSMPPSRAPCPWLSARASRAARQHALRRTPDTSCASGHLAPGRTGHTDQRAQLHQCLIVRAGVAFGIWSTTRTVNAFFAAGVITSASSLYSRAKTLSTLPSTAGTGMPNAMLATAPAV